MIFQVKHFILEADYAFYQKLVGFLVPKVLKSIPNNLTQAIRNFAKSLEAWMAAAMQKAPEHLRVIKVTTVRSLSQALRRYTGLNHLAQAARAVLQNGSHIGQMLSDLNRVDFANVQEQGANSIEHQTAQHQLNTQTQPNLDYQVFSAIISIDVSVSR